MRTYLISLFIIITFTIQLSAKQKQKENESRFQNLQVLPKDISDHALDSIMDNFKFSLGVKCNFCHARFADTSNHHLDFTSDAKEEKKTARKMFLMTKEINAKNFSDNKTNVDAVVCFTCHRGTSTPDSRAMLSHIDSLNEEEHKRWKK